MNVNLRRLLSANRPGIISAAIALLCGCACIQNWHRWTAVDIPLGSRTEITTQFESDLNGTYFAQIDMQRGDVDAEHALIVPKMSIRVMSEDGVRVDEPEGGGYWGETVGKTIAKFHAEPGKRYYIRWEQTAKSEAFSKRSPRLQVVVSPSVMKNAVVQCGFLGMIAAASGLFALILFLRELDSGKSKCIAAHR